MHQRTMENNIYCGFDLIIKWDRCYEKGMFGVVGEWMGKVKHRSIWGELESKQERVNIVMLTSAPARQVKDLNRPRPNLERKQVKCRHLCVCACEIRSANPPRLCTETFSL